MARDDWDPTTLPDLSGKRYLVTGSTAGLGFFSSLQLAGAGAHVIMTGRNPNKLAVARAAVRRQVPDAEIATLLLVPVVDGRPDGYGQGVAAAAMAWTLLALPVLAVAAAERRMRDHRVRGILVTTTLVAVALVRPVLNEMLVGIVFHGHSNGVWLARTGTNLVVAFGLFSLIAIITTEYSQTRATVDRLAHALGRLDAASQQVLNDERDARLVVRGMVAELRTERDAMLAGTVDFDAVRDFSERVRSAQLMPAPASTETVAFGSTVTFSRDDGRVQTYRIVGEDEADPKAGSISYVSPVARLLVGKGVGDVVSMGGQELEITAIA